MLPLSTCGGRTRARINHVRRRLRQSLRKHVSGKARTGSNTQGGTRVELRVRPTVQGIAVVLENKTGRVLAMVGGFSYPLSQLNRVTQARRQPGSSFKPMTYLAALNSGLQPNTLVEDAPITYPPIGGVNRYTRDTDYWSPHNYDGGSSGTMTMRRALEHSKNLVTARLLDGGIASDPSAEPRRDLQARDRGASLSEMRAVLSVRARRPAGAADRPRGLLCRDRQRGQTPDAARDRADHAGRPRNLQGRRRPDAARRRSIRRRCSSSARSCKAWWRAAPRRA